MDSDDLTARARIRDAALRLFAERGTAATGVRDIAREAGVSPGLLRHHFGTKEALRDACDAYALRRAMDIKAEALDGGLAAPGFLPSVEPTMLLLKKYLGRAAVDGSPAAAAMFDELVAATEQWLAGQEQLSTRDSRAYAAVLTAMTLGLVVLHEHVSRAIGTDMMAPVGHARAVVATVEVLSQPLVGPELADQAASAFAAAHGRPAQPGPDTTDGKPSSSPDAAHDVAPPPRPAAARRGATTRPRRRAATTPKEQPDE
jgi:AcrR family transcriptional regulator